MLFIGSYIHNPVGTTSSINYNSGRRCAKLRLSFTLLTIRVESYFNFQPRLNCQPNKWNKGGSRARAKLLRNRLQRLPKFANSHLASPVAAKERPLGKITDLNVSISGAFV